MMSRRRWRAPEVLQTSAMDCGPATLKCLLEGFGVHASYDRLREACQTDVDGTTIDTLEEIAVSLGLDAEQILLPADHLLLPEAAALPCIAVVRLPTHELHFVVIWRVHGSLVEVMDPAVGRRWMTRRTLLSELYEHSMQVPAAQWREWAAGDEFIAPLKSRMHRLALSAKTTEMTDQALAVPDWRRLGQLDALTRLADSLCEAGALRKGSAAQNLVTQLFKASIPGEMNAVLDSYRHVSSAPVEADTENVIVRGAVVVRCRGVHAVERTLLPPELAAALSAPVPQPLRTLWRLIEADGRMIPRAIILAAVTATIVVLLEALLFYSFLDIGEQITLASQRAVPSLILLGVLIAALCVDGSLAVLLSRMGRHLEVRMRSIVQERLPRFPDRHFRSRLTSDMAERAHRTSQLRELPDLAGQALRVSLELVLTAAAIVWLDGAWLWACVAVCLAFLVPLAALPMLKGADLKWATHGGALARFHLDALLGLVPVRSLGAQKSFRLAHEDRLVEWFRAGSRLAQLTTLLNAAQWVVGLALIAWLVSRHFGAQDYPAALLLIYWGIKVLLLSHELASLVRRYPQVHTLTLRLLEPLTAAIPEAGEQSAPINRSTGDQMGVAIEMAEVDVLAGGHTVLEKISLRIDSGEHIAIVGSSGAGKSSLLGLLLGWHVPSAGSCRLDGQELTGPVLAKLRRETAWVDPAVQIWNRSLYENLRYGSFASDSRVAANVADAGLTSMLQHLPRGLQTALGEGGTLVSGGEGQRVRFGRALGREDARLVLLDEPFRGLGQEDRSRLLACARQRWSNATLLLVTHDIAVSQELERVIVVDGGRVVEDGTPSVLKRNPDSRYTALLAQEAKARAALWGDPGWRRLRLERGELTERR
ncbi:MAG: Lipid export ATP-binding/permease protein MsbA [Gammaproteobacteria bacterium]|nr:Lipid export ATP-binding/permease protein MsbA [Gammaproteobacteria bacterium]